MFRVVALAAVLVSPGCKRENPGFIENSWDSGVGSATTTATTDSITAGPDSDGSASSTSSGSGHDTSAATSESMTGLSVTDSGETTRESVTDSSTSVAETSITSTTDPNTSGTSVGSTVGSTGADTGDATTGLEPGQCLKVSDCGTDKYCDFPENNLCGFANSDPGVCKPRPLQCNDPPQNVYGCDCGPLYANPCEAAKAGFDVSCDDLQMCIC